MRHIATALFITAITAGCATNQPAATILKPQAAATTDAAAKPAQCYSGETSKFHGVNDKSEIAGIKVVCTASADGKSATWHTAKH